MKKHLGAIALVVSLAQPASAITFPSLTTIYVGSGVTEFDGTAQIATAFSCSNVSGQSASVRFLVLNSNGSVAASTTHTLAHGTNVTVATSEVMILLEANLALTDITHGTVNIESTQSGVFCTAMMLDPTADRPNGVMLHMVRVNAHPGTVE